MAWTPSASDVARCLPERCRLEDGTFGFSTTTYPTTTDVSAVITNVVAEITARIGTIPASCETLAKFTATVGAARDVELFDSGALIGDERSKADQLTARYESLLSALTTAVAAAVDTDDDGEPGGPRYFFPDPTVTKDMSF